MIALDVGDAIGALRLLVDHALIARDLVDPLTHAVSACRIAAAVTQLGEPTLAVQLIASAAVVQTGLGSNIPWVEKDNRQTIARARAALDDEAFAAAWRTGSSMPIDEALQLALDRANELLESLSSRLPGADA